MLPRLKRQLHLEQLEPRALLAGDAIIPTSGFEHPIAVLPIGWFEGELADWPLPAEPLSEIPQATFEPVGDPELPAEEAASDVEPSIPRAAQAAIRLEITDLIGQPIESIRVGESFRLQVYVDDLRAQPQGTFYAMIDTEFDSALADFASWVDIGGFMLRQGRSWSGTGIVDDLGANFSMYFDHRRQDLLYSIDLTALRPGELLFNTSLGEAIAGHFLLQLGRGTPVFSEEIDFGTASLQILENPALPSGFVPDSPQVYPDSSNWSVWRKLLDFPRYAQSETSTMPATKEPVSASQEVDIFNWCPVGLLRSTDVPLPPKWLPAELTKVLDDMNVPLSDIPLTLPTSIAPVGDSVRASPVSSPEFEDLWLTLDFLFSHDDES